MDRLDDNLRRAAILVMSLDEAAAEAVLERLPEDDAARVRRMLVELDGVDPDEERRTVDEFMRGRPPRQNRGVELDPRLARRIEATTKKTPATPPADDHRPFRFLHAARGEKITPFIAGEHPQTIAVIVSHLPDDRAADVLASLDAELQADVVERLIDLDQANPDVVREVEHALESRMLEQALAERRQESGLESVARILDAAEPSLRRSIMKNLSRHDRRLAERLRPQRFDFADLDQVDDATLAAIFGAVDAEVTQLALAGADERLVDRLLRLLGPVEAKKMRRTIERLGPMRLSDVEEAQHEVARVARQLVLDGAIDLQGGGHLLAVA
ncbi:MAG TPA: FliG C-terminal domain-containing protein [Pirellulales bacterium]|nr:FliG C-terminal domain-containing protein [Pirellulales bacterium]